MIYKQVYFSPFLAVLISILPGCATYHHSSTTLSPSSSDIAVPSAWNQTLLGQASIEMDWWQNFNTPELVELVNRAIEHNPDLAISTERIRQAELQMRISQASLFPSANVGGNTAWQRSDGANRSSSIDKSSGISLGVSYEIDLWGRLAAGAEGAQATLKASQFDQQTVRLTLISGVATAYFQILALRERLTIAQENLASAERISALVNSRFRYGSASGLDVSRQNTAVLSQRATLQSLKLQEQQTLNALAVLLGTAPQGFILKGQTLHALQVPQASPGLPAQLLTRRPDLASQEALLLAAGANIKAAQAALLPSIQLTGSAGLASNALLSLANPSNSINLAASIAQTIFDGGRLRNQVKISESRQRETLENYRKSIYTALKEVEDALSAVNFNDRQEALQTQIYQEAQRSFSLSERRYKEGADDLLSLLDTQRTLFQAKDQVSQLRLTRLSNAIDLFKALGGGWKRPS
ncbi:MAG: efflux transporter outer membrane subunit [Pseudomonadota bacterium]